MSSVSEILLFIGSLYNLFFAIFHLFFWRLFKWKEDLKRISHINRQIMQIMNLCLIFVFLVMSYVSFFHANELLTTSLGNTLLFAIGLFWLLRAIEQVYFFGFRRLISIIFFVSFLLGSILYIVLML